MSFLDGLFEQTVPELPVAAEVVDSSRVVKPGYLYRIAASDAAIVLTITPHAAVAGQRFAVKVYAPTPTGPGGALTVTVPAAQQIEAGNGLLGSSFELPSQTLGLYREWVCDADGRWMLVEGGWE